MVDRKDLLREWSADSLWLSIPLGSASATESHLTWGHALPRITLILWLSEAGVERAGPFRRLQCNTDGQCSLQSFPSGWLKLCWVSSQSQLLLPLPSPDSSFLFHRYWSLRNILHPNSVNIYFQKSQLTTLLYSPVSTTTFLPSLYNTAIALCKLLFPKALRLLVYRGCMAHCGLRALGLPFCLDIYLF